MFRIETIKKYGCVLLYLLLTSGTLLFSQTVSTKKDIAVFRLVHSSSMPDEVAIRLDQRITAVITSFKRFNVIGMQYRLKAADTAAFIQKIQEAKADLSALPEAVLSGEEAFTRANWEQLTAAFLVFVPQISAYDESLIYEEARTRDGTRIIKPYWKVSIEGSLSIIDAAGATSLRTIPFSATSILTQRSDAIDSVIEDIAASIYNTIKFESAFTLTTGVIGFDRRSNTVTVELGKDMGIRTGDEYSLQKTVFVGGNPSCITTGLCIISQVHDTFSIAKVIYADQPIVEGDSVKESPSSHFTMQGYGGITIPLTGVQQSPSNNYLRVQPTFGFKITYLTSFHIGLSFGYEYAIQRSLNLSGEYANRPLKLSPFGTVYLGLGVCNLYAARFKITPELQLLYSGTHVYAQSSSKTRYGSSFATTTASHIGGRALLSIDYFISQGWTFGAEVGLGYSYAITSLQQTVQRLQNDGFLSAQDARRINNYEWNILNSHLQFYSFLGITGRF